LEGYFESLAQQGFQNNPFFRSGTKKWGLAPPKGALTFQVVFRTNARALAHLKPNTIAAHPKPRSRYPLPASAKRSLVCLAEGGLTWDLGTHLPD